MERIGKRIFRDHHDCCTHCTEVFNDGLIVADEQHADYLASTDVDFAVEGFELNYRNIK